MKAFPPLVWAQRDILEFGLIFCRLPVSFSLHNTSLSGSLLTAEKIGGTQNIYT